MKPALLRYHTPARQLVAAATLPHAAAFADNNGLDLVDVSISGDDPGNKWYQKPGLALSQLPERPFVIYADCDVVFRTGAELRQFPTFDYPFSVSQDSSGLCAGFFIATHESLALLQAWKMMGEPIEPSSDPSMAVDQGVLKTLVKRPWAFEMLCLIPERTVSNPKSRLKGSVAHHLWSRGIGDHQAAELVNRGVFNK